MNFISKDVDPFIIEGALALSSKFRVVSRFEPETHDGRFLPVSIDGVDQVILFSLGEAMGGIASLQQNNQKLELEDMDMMRLQLGLNTVVIVRPRDAGSQVSGAIMVDEVAERFENLAAFDILHGEGTDAVTRIGFTYMGHLAKVREIHKEQIFPTVATLEHSTGSSIVSLGPPHPYDHMPQFTLILDECQFMEPRFAAVAAVNVIEN